jgi:N-acetylmuramoyl-L-alanine amidase
VSKVKETVLYKKSPGYPGRFFVVFLITLFLFSLNTYANRPVVVVLDPGHGGKNLGAQFNGYIEKDMNVIVAHAMRAELEKYEGIVVYLTHEDGEDDMNLKERAEFAADKNADFMFALHFNMSETGILYGAEVWVSAFDEFYARGHAFGQIQMAAFREMGLFDRGIKTRINNSDEDYYGIIRESRSLGINTVLLEFCHLDHINDQDFYALGDFQLEEFGRISATAVAKYFQLKSIILDVDYSNYPVPVVAVPTEIVRPDLTPPDISHIELLSLDEENRVAVFHLLAEDHDSLILYYGISLDGGLNFDLLEPFPEDAKELTVSVNLPPEKEIRAVFMVLNAYDRITQSNTIAIRALPGDPLAEEAGAEDEPAEIIDISLAELTQELSESREQMEQGMETYQMVILGLVALMVLVVIITGSRVLLWKRKRRS